MSRLGLLIAVLLVACSSGTAESDSASTSTVAPTTTSSTTTTSTSTTSTTTAPTTTTTTVPSGPTGPANAAAATLEGYGDELSVNLAFAVSGGCGTIVEQIAVELDALAVFTLEFFEALADDERSGSVDIDEMELNATLLGQKWIVLDNLLDAVIELGGGSARYAALIDQDVNPVGFALLAWAAFGIDTDSSEYSMNSLEEFGFTEHFGNVQFRSLDAESPDLAGRYC